MSLKYSEAFNDPKIARHLADHITRTSRKTVRFMEVCGTHTVSIFRSGIRSLLPETISLLSGPGCPVCVTAQKEIDAFIALAREPETIVATFGDLIRVPGSGSSLQGDLNSILSETFSFPIPATPLPVDGYDVSLLELYHGPTLAFKDVALQLVGSRNEVTCHGEESCSPGRVVIRTVVDRHDPGFQ